MVIHKTLSFISVHLVQQINARLNERIKILQGEPGDFIYFDEPITFYSGRAKFKINRMGLGRLYCKDLHTSLDWQILGGSTLLEVLTKIKSNQFYTHRKFVGSNGRIQYLKTRIKSNINDTKESPVLTSS